MKTATSILLVALFFYATVSVTIFLLQRNLIFAPSTERVLPHEVGLGHVDEVILTMADGSRLYSWFGQGQPDQPTLLYFHGNGQSVSHRRGKMQQLLARGYSTFILGYPGYGGSEGAPSEASFMEAASLAYHHLRNSGIASEQIVIYGESLGSAVAVQLAAKQQARALILAAPMSSVREIAQSLYPYLPVSLLLKDTFLSIDFIDQVEMPTLVLHGTDDQVIPIESGQKLYDAAKHPKLFHTVESAGHNNLYDFDVVDVMHGFITST